MFIISDVRDVNIRNIFLIDQTDGLCTHSYRNLKTNIWKSKDLPIRAKWRQLKVKHSDWLIFRILVVASGKFTYVIFSQSTCLPKGVWQPIMHSDIKKICFRYFKRKGTGRVMTSWITKVKISLCSLTRWSFIHFSVFECYRKYWWIETTLIRLHGYRG